jgi:RadC-like JAB domain
LIISSYLVTPKLAGRPAFPNDDAIDVACLVPALVNLPFGPRVNVVVPRQNSQGTVIIILVHNRPSSDPTSSRADIEMTRSLWKSQSPWGSLYTTTSSSEKKDMRVSRG